MSSLNDNLLLESNASLLLEGNVISAYFDRKLESGTHRLLQNDIAKRALESVSGALTGLIIDQYSSPINTDIVASGTVTCDLSEFNQHLIVLDSSTTNVIFVNPTAGQRILLLIKQATSGGPYTTINWPTGFNWMISTGFSEPTIPTSASSYCAISALCIDDSTPTYLAWWLGNSNIAESYTLSGPSSGAVGIPAIYTITPSGPYTGQISVTPSGVTPAGGGTSQEMIGYWDGTSNAWKFSITTFASGTVTLAISSSPELSGPTSANYVASGNGYQFWGPPSGVQGVASKNFHILVPSTTISGTVIFTPSDNGAGGTFSPTTLSLTSADQTSQVVSNGTFVYTPLSSYSGNITISVTNNGGYVNSPAITYLVIHADATTYTVEGPVGGLSGIASRNFTIAPNGVYTGTITITPSGGGLSTPITKTWSASSSSQTFTITPTSTGTVNLTFTNSGSLSNTPIRYYVSRANLSLAFTSGLITFGVNQPQGVSSTSLQIGNFTTQCDIKNSWPDGSIKFAILTANITSSGTYSIASHAAASGSFTPTLPGSTYVTFVISGVTWTATLPSSYSGSDLWLNGPLVVESRYVVSPMNGGNAHPFLKVRFDVRSYSTGVWRVDIAGENIQNISAATEADYSLSIVVNGSTVYTNGSVAHCFMTRWRKSFYVGYTPGTVVPDLTMAAACGALPYYDSVNIPNSTGGYTDYGFGLMQTGNVDTFMGDYGEDLVRTGLMPMWVGRVMLFQNATELATMMSNADLAGTWPVHLIQPNGQPVDCVNYPNFWYDSRGAGSNSNNGWIGTSTGPVINGVTLNPDLNHTPSLCYVPYLITGDRFYNDEMRYWASWGTTAPNPGNRGSSGAGGLIMGGAGAMRGLAWTMRQMADAAAYLPDSDTTWRTYLVDMLNNNLSWSDTNVLGGPSGMTGANSSTIGPIGSNPLGCFEYITYNSGNGQWIFSLEHGGYLVWSIEHINDLAIPSLSGGRITERGLAEFASNLYNDPVMIHYVGGSLWLTLSNWSPPIPGPQWFATIAEVATIGNYNSPSLLGSGSPENNDDIAPHVVSQAKIGIMYNVSGSSSIYNRLLTHAEYTLAHTFSIHGILLRGEPL